MERRYISLNYREDMHIVQQPGCDVEYHIRAEGPSERVLRVSVPAAVLKVDPEADSRDIIPEDHVYGGS